MPIPKTIFPATSTTNRETQRPHYFIYYKTDGTTVKIGYRYTYDAAGNIKQVYSREGEKALALESSYEYDKLGQLTKADTGAGVETYTYDTAGNMLSRTQSSTTKTYQYANTQWGDLLTTYYGQKIAYEGQTYSTSNTVSGTPVSGNPISYYGAGNRRWNMTWKNGRQLASATSTGRTVSYEYDKNGLRTSKTYNGTKYSYAYAGNKLVWQGWNGNEMYFFYDYAGTPVAFWYFPKGGSRITGYYFTNQQGDVVRIEDPDGNVLASYAYNAWGTMYKSSGTMANINPLRYRGYYYDAETDFYYLQSRYYDPIVSRFINADSYASTGQGFLGYNMFLYCGNNPVNRTDAAGSRYARLDDFGGGGIVGSSSTFDKIGDTALAFFQSATISAGVGAGLQGSAHVSPIVTSGGAKVDILAIELHCGKGVRIGQRGEAGVSIGLDGSFGDAGKALHIGESESFFKSHLNYGWCPEHGWTWCECPNEETTNGVKSILGISASAYFIAGVSFDAGFDMNYFSEQFALIWK